MRSTRGGSSAAVPSGIEGCAVVTGAANGIGRAIALRLAAGGRRLALIDQDRDGLDRVLESLNGRGDPADQASTAHVADVTDSRQVSDAIEDIERVNGPIEALAHAVGVLQTGAILDADPAVSRHTFDVNVMGVLNVARCAGLKMRTRRSGAMVIVGSNAAGVPRANMGIYGASKAAAEMLTRVIGLELAGCQVRANMVAPGSTDTGMLAAMYPDRDAMIRASIDGDPAAFRPGIPLGRIADPDDIAGVVEFLLSSDARHITMQTVYVDGGAALHA
ncbi:SDR family oxidoreductase [Rhodococcus daqingensis]|uniref:SDR family oxidoreductase n=1 Tax=Rhodococcus daqingensis TaxID=2479363 RepID=A0ABW2RXT6_9NOCA